jgi:hypothetical protein
MPGALIGPITGFVDRMKGKGMCSSSFLQQIGNSSAQSAGGGNIFSLLSAAGVGNGADATDDTLMSCSLPARLFDIAGRCVTVQGFGTTAATAVVKTIQFKFGASALQSIVVEPSGGTGAGSWQFLLQIFKISSNVQALLYQADASGTPTTVLGISAGRGVLYAAGAEVDTAAIPLVITGKGPSTANAVLCNGMIVDAYN